jgi:hypothetical protein
MGRHHAARNFYKEGKYILDVNIDFLITMEGKK